MKIVEVKFSNYGKLYRYNTDLDLMIGGIYSIVADKTTSYMNPIIVVDIYDGHDTNLRTITSAMMLRAPKRPEKPYDKIFVNYDKQTVCVVWKDGSKTIMRPCEGDEFDVEKGVALCFMKKAFHNRGCYYDTFKDIIEQ